MKNVFYTINSVFVAIMLFFNHSYAEQPDLSSLAKQGKQALESKFYSDAQESFTKGYRLARLQQAGEEWQARFLFYLGNSYLTEASESGEFTAKNKDQKYLARNAVGAYRRVVYMRPNSGTAKVNLARALTLMGDFGAADVLYQQAIELGGQKEPKFRQQYAEFLVERNPAQAIKQLTIVIRAQPKNLKAHRKMVTIFRKPQYSSQLPQYLTEQIKLGEVLRAQDTAIEFLLDSGLSSKIYDELVIILASSLAQQHIAPKDFVISDTAMALKEIAKAQPHLSDCMNELLQTLSKGEAVKYRWWAENSQRSSELSNLLRSMGDYFDQSDQPKRAEQVYRGAVELRGAKDPNAVTDLIGFYSKRGDLESINEISNTYEFRLFQGKAMAYKSGDAKAIYDYHRTLASIYSFQASKTGDWGSSSKANSATFQLEHAYRTASRSKNIIPDTKLIGNLATSYEIKGNKKKANEVRIESAEKYKKSGNSIAADKVLETVKKENLSGSQLRSYKRVRDLPITTSVLNVPKLNELRVNSSNFVQPTSAPKSAPTVEKQAIEKWYQQRDVPVKTKQATPIQTIVIKQQKINTTVLQVPTKEVTENKSPD